jgi:organic hydroperoxide reductase OsmC/OhrA
MENNHNYKASVKWTGNKGSGTMNYISYGREHTISVPGKADISCSSDADFRGDDSLHNPEELLVSSLAACHMLWYLHLCAEEGVVVVDYVDDATGIMVEAPGEVGHFSEVVLNPKVTVTSTAMFDKARRLHEKAGSLCFIANSVNFPVKHKPVIVIKESDFSKR